MAKTPVNAAPDIKWTERIVSISELTPYEKNPRKITDDQIQTLTESIQKFGQFRPLLVTHDLRLAGGHQRLKVFKKLGWDKVRVSVPDRVLTDAEFKEIVIRDNVENGVWDQEVLAEDYTPEELAEYGVAMRHKAMPEAYPLRAILNAFMSGGYKREILPQAKVRK